MSEFILEDVKNLLGLPVSYTIFDTAVIIHINTVFSILTQMGVGPKEGFVIEDNSTKWTDYITCDNKKMQSIKTYIYLKVKMVFDPPTSSAYASSINATIAELEFRLYLEEENSREVLIKAQQLEGGS